MQRPRNLLPPILIFLTACASSALVLAADDPPASKSGATDTAPAPSASKPPMVTKNPDGTITVRKEPSKGHSKGVKSKERLVIPAQVIAPTYQTPEKKQ
jgi:hypothetical protein